MSAVSSRIKVLFAPDWRAGNPYQRLLAEGLAEHGVDVVFAPQTQGLFRLAKAARAVGPFDLLHVHWPEAYFPVLRDKRDFPRRVLFPMDLRLALAGRPLVYTGHNLYPHSAAHTFWVRRACRAVVCGAGAVLAHSAGSVTAYAEEFGVARERCHVIPHGDLSVSLPPPPAPAAARARLGLGAGRICLVFGAVDPYKGIEEILAAWAAGPASDVRLAIIGKPSDPAYAARIAALAAKAPGTILKLERVEEPELADWMAACDCMLFNYRAILTSGSACLARAWGVPVVLPERLGTVDLMEPDPSVVRFGDTPQAMVAAVRRAAAGMAWEHAAPYRAATGWRQVAHRTAEIYRALLSDCG